MGTTEGFSRLSRYEALLEFSTRVNTCTQVDETSGAAASRLKYVADIYAWRYLCLDEHLGPGEGQTDELLLVDAFRGRTSTGMSRRTELSAPEQRWLDEARVQIVEGDDLRLVAAGLPAPFAKEDVLQLYVYPVLRRDVAQALFVFAKRRGPLTELDLKFLHAAAQLYHDKVHHLRRDEWLTSALRGEIAERTRAQAALQSMNEHLEERVRERTAELEHKNVMLAKTTQSFGRFVPLEYLDFLGKESILDVQLGDHVAAEMAVLFSDIRSFTSLSEAMTPAENFEFVNRYLREVSPVIRNGHGIIVKFLGDGMMAVFPRSVADAVAAGIETLHRVAGFNEERRSRGEPPIVVGIGVHVGRMMMGMVGEEHRMQGDAFSDTVNLTQRIEGLTKHYGASMIVSGDVLGRLAASEPRWTESGREALTVRYLDRVVVKGRREPIDVHEVLDGLDVATMGARRASRERFQRAVTAYRTREFDEADASFAAVLGLDPSDSAASLYRDRIARCREDGVPDGWDGVTYLDAK